MAFPISPFSELSASCQWIKIFLCPDAENLSWWCSNDKAAGLVTTEVSDIIKGTWQIQPIHSDMLSPGPEGYMHDTSLVFCGSLYHVPPPLARYMYNTAYLFFPECYFKEVWTSFQIAFYTMNKVSYTLNNPFLLEGNLKNNLITRCPTAVTPVIYCNLR